MTVHTLGKKTAESGGGHDMPLRGGDDGIIDATWQRLEDRLDWYDRQSLQAWRAYRRLKATQIGLAALVLFLAGFQHSLVQLLPAALALLPTLLLAAIGVALVVLEGVQHLNQYQHSWLSSRAMCEALAREKFLFLADAGPYAHVEDTRVRLAERIEELIARDHTSRLAGRHGSSRLA